MRIEHFNIKLNYLTVLSNRVSSYWPYYLMNNGGTNSKYRHRRHGCHDTKTQMLTPTWTGIFILL